MPDPDPPPPRDQPSTSTKGEDRKGLCEATLASGELCKYKAKAEAFGCAVCHVHRRQWESRRAAHPECPVCLDPVPKRGRATMACGHAFHAKCLRSWFRQRQLTCPMCRATCLEGMALLGGRKMCPKLHALVRTVPPPPRAFFPSYILSHLESPAIVAALGADPSTVELVVDLACQSFTRDIFFAKMRALGL